MKNYAAYIVYVESDNRYEFFSPKNGIDFEDVFFSYNKQIPRRIYYEIDQVKKYKLRRMPNPFKNNDRKYS